MLSRAATRRLGAASQFVEDYRRGAKVTPGVYSASITPLSAGRLGCLEATGLAGGPARHRRLGLPNWARDPSQIN